MNRVDRVRAAIAVVTATAVLGGGWAVADAVRDDDARDAPIAAGPGDRERQRAFPLVASPDGTGLEAPDGEPFTYLADTVWLAPSRLDQEDWVALLDTRRAQGFTAIQVSLLPFTHLPGGPENVYGDPAVEGTDLSSPVEVGGRSADPTSPDYDYWDHVDFLLTSAAQRGMPVTLVPSWYGFRGEDWRGHVTTEAAREYGTFLGERLGGHRNVLWLLGGDNAPVGDVSSVPSGESTADVLEATRTMARAIAAAEEVTHLMSYHGTRRTGSLEDFADDDWHTFASAYSDQLTWKHVADSTGRGLPVVMTEAFYDGREQHTRVDRRQLRAQAWWSVLGGAGYAYGHEDVWDLDPGHGPDSDGGPDTWQESLDAPSAGDVTVLADAVRGLGHLTPADHLLTGGRGSGDSRVVAATGAGGRTALVYLPERRTITLDLDRFDAASVRVSWLDPATGTVVDAGSHDGGGTLELAPPDDLQDAVVLVRAA